MISGRTSPFKAIHGSVYEQRDMSDYTAVAQLTVDQCDTACTEPEGHYLSVQHIVTILLAQKHMIHTFRVALQCIQHCLQTMDG